MFAEGAGVRTTALHLLGVIASPAKSLIRNDSILTIPAKADTDSAREGPLPGYVRGIDTSLGTSLTPSKLKGLWCKLDELT
jgi:hypothetical protein